MSICSGEVKVRFAVLVVLLCGVVAAGGCSAKNEPAPPSAAEQAINEYQQGALLLESGRFDEAVSPSRRALEMADDNVLCR